ARSIYAGHPQREEWKPGRAGREVHYPLGRVLPQRVVAPRAHRGGFRDRIDVEAIDGVRADGDAKPRRAARKVLRQIGRHGHIGHEGLGSLAAIRGQRGREDEGTVGAEGGVERPQRLGAREVERLGRVRDHGDAFPLEPRGERAADMPAGAQQYHARRPGAHRPRLSHFIAAALSRGCDTRPCHTTAWKASAWAVTRSGLTVGMMTQASATFAVNPPSRPTIPATRAPTALACSSARTRLVLTLRSESTPPTEKTSTASRAERRLPLSQLANEVSQPSSLMRAVSSETLSVGAYASKPAIFRKSLTACDALPALPPTPRMKRRPPPSRTAIVLQQNW